MFTDVSEVLAASTIRVMMEAASTSEMLVNFYQTTWHNKPEDSHLQCCSFLETENLGKNCFVFENCM
jgi:hypothetical protein